MFKLHLKEIRKARGMSQQELADAIGVTKFVLGTWEREDTKLPLDKACDIARALNCTLDQLAGRDEIVIDDAERKAAEAFKKLRKRSKMSITYEVIDLDKQLDEMQSKLDMIRKEIKS